MKFFISSIKKKKEANLLQNIRKAKALHVCGVQESPHIVLNRSFLSGKVSFTMIK